MSQMASQQVLTLRNENKESNLIHGVAVEGKSHGPRILFRLVPRSRKVERIVLEAGQSPNVQIPCRPSRSISDLVMHLMLTWVVVSKKGRNRYIAPSPLRLYRSSKQSTNGNDSWGVESRDVNCGDLWKQLSKKRRSGKERPLLVLYYSWEQEQAIDELNATELPLHAPLKRKHPSTGFSANRKGSNNRNNAKQVQIMSRPLQHTPGSIPSKSSSSMSFYESNTRSILPAPVSRFSAGAQVTGQSTMTNRSAKARPEDLFGSLKSSATGSKAPPPSSNISSSSSIFTMFPLPDPTSIHQHPSRDSDSSQTVASFTIPSSNVPASGSISHPKSYSNQSNLSVVPFTDVSLTFPSTFNLFSQNTLTDPIRIAAQQ